MGGGPERRGAEHEAAVALQGHHAAPRIGQRRPHRGREPPAEGAAAVGEPGGGRARADHGPQTAAGGEGLVHHQVVALHDVRHGAGERGGVHPLAVRRRLHARPRRRPGGGRPPRRPGRGAPAPRAGARAQALAQPGEPEPHVAHQADGGRVDLAHLVGVDLQVHERRPRRAGRCRG